MGQLALCATTEYRPRSPEQTVLYKAVANHMNAGANPYTPADYKKSH